MGAEVRPAAGEGQVPRCEREDLAAWAGGLKSLLRFHQLLGIRSYPLTAELRGAESSPPAAGPGLPEHGGEPAASPTPVPEGCSAGKKSSSPDRLSRLRDDISQCSSCVLAADRRGHSLGRGQVGAQLMVVGDYLHGADKSPPGSLFGSEEDVLFGRMIQAMQLTGEQVYVSNIIKCCPSPGWEAPRQAPRCCLGFLHREIGLVRPRVLLAMGDLTARSLLGSELSALRLRGRFHDYRPDPESPDAVALMVTLHPHTLLAEPAMKKAVWADLQMVLRRLARG